MSIDLFLMGTPAPGGSKTAIALRRRGGALVLGKGGRPILRYVDDGKGNKKWKADITRSAKLQYRGKPLRGPLRVLFRFYMRRPQDHHVANNRRRELRLDAPIWPEVKPDASKLVRSTEDALTGLLWVDDAQIVQQYAEKVYAGSHEPCGCRLMVTEVVPDFAPEGLFSAEAIG